MESGPMSLIGNEIGASRNASGLRIMIITAKLENREIVNRFWIRLEITADATSPIVNRINLFIVGDQRQHFINLTKAIYTSH